MGDHYGKWLSVTLLVLAFTLYGIGFLAPRGRREWRSMGVYTAFIVALFTEMFGFPLTIYILTALLGSRYPVLDPFGHLGGHLWAAFLAGGSPAAVNLAMVLDGLFELTGFGLLAIGWWQIHRARGWLVTSGLYAWMRHPQYTGLGLIIVGLLLMWPTIPTLIMGPILLVAYGRLARREEARLVTEFGEAYLEYCRRVPRRFLPRIPPGQRLWATASVATFVATFLVGHWLFGVPVLVGIGSAGSTLAVAAWPLGVYHLLWSALARRFAAPARGEGPAPRALGLSSADPAGADGTEVRASSGAKTEGSRVGEAGRPSGAALPGITTG